MENATKALLIAAAILIAIVLVSIGVFVLRQGQEAVGSVNMSEAEILAFNGKFESYVGTQRGSNVKALKDRVEIANREQGTDGANVELKGDVSNINTSHYYKVEITKKDNSGLIKEITVTDQSGN